MKNLEEVSPNIQQCLKQFAKDSGYPEEELKVKLEAGSEKFCNFHGDIFRAVISSPTRNTRVILKCGIPDIVYTNSSLLFGNEINFYTIVHPSLKRYHDEMIGGDFLRVPNHYGNTKEENKEVIVLEDMCADGFTIQSAREGLSYEQCRLVLQKLAKFHATSEAMRQKNRQEFDKLKENMKEAYVPTLSEERNTIVEVYMKTTETLGKELIRSKMNAKESELACKNLDDFLMHFRKSLTRNPDLPLTVHNLGDCWTSNLMFKMERGKAVDVCFLDFQMTRVGSPVLDMLEFLIISSRDEILLNHLSEMIDYYYDIFKTTLSSFGAEVSRGEFKRHLLTYSRYALSKLFLLFPRIFSQASAGEDATSNSAEENVDLSVLFQNEFTQNCIINSISSLLKHNLLHT